MAGTWSTARSTACTSSVPADRVTLARGVLIGGVFALTTDTLVGVEVSTTVLLALVIAWFQRDTVLG